MAEVAEYEAESVTAITRRLKGALERGFPRVFVEGEIRDWRAYPSGHRYFTLKDEGAALSCVMFAGYYNACLRKHPGIETRLRDGAKVTAGGAISVYESRGQYQLAVRGLKLSGEGELMRRFLELKAKLEREGLFDAVRKRPLPFLPRRIGVITSEAGAVIHDFCRVATRRMPNVEIRLFPATVQGDAAPASLIAGLKHFNGGDWRPDLIVIGRGGGSFEDLFCFNDETLVRELAASAIPTIAAIGHETDFTLCDYVADRRAGTPSMAAEFAVPVKADLVAKLGVLAGRLSVALRGRGESCAQRVDHLTDALAKALDLARVRAENRLGRGAARLSPAMRLSLSQAEHRVQKGAAALVPSMRMAFERVSARLGRSAAELSPAMTLAFRDAEARLRRDGEKLALLSPYGVLERGYALVTDASGAVVRAADSVGAGDRVMVRVAAGAFGAVVEATEGSGS